MGMTKKEDYIHTPAPWRMVNDTEEGNLGVKILASKTDTEICYIYLDEPLEDITGNASLIKHAPELFHGCIDALAELSKSSKNEVLIKRLEKLIASTGFTERDLDE